MSTLSTNTTENHDDIISRVAADLATEFPRFSEELVLTIVRDSVVEVRRTAKVKQHVIPLAERFARQRLSDMAGERGGAQAQVLFLCVANAGRSQLAAAMLNHLSGGKVIARSAGSIPAEDVHPKVRSLLQDMAGENKDEPFPKPITDDAVRAADVVVTMGCGDVCPILPGVRYEDWAVGDPAAASDEELAAIAQDINQRVRSLINQLTTN